MEGLWNHSPTHLWMAGLCSRLCDGLMAQTCPGDTAVQGVKADPCTPPDLPPRAPTPGGGGRPTKSVQLHNLTSGTEYLVSVFPSTRLASAKYPVWAWRPQVCA